VNSGYLNVGQIGNGILNITNGGVVSNNVYGQIGYIVGSTGVVNVDGVGSTWSNAEYLFVGRRGQGTLNITNGGAVSNTLGYIGHENNTTGEVTVDGAGSTWKNTSSLYVGYSGGGTLSITNGGLVSVVGVLTIDIDLDGDGVVNMASGGMLALYGEADGSLVEFQGLIDGTDAIRYWDDSISDWADISGATRESDYTLVYMADGDLAGYTMLTVPEPATVTILALGGLLALRRRKRQH